MTSTYEIFLFALALLFGLVLRRAAPVVELSVVEQLERRLNTMENQKRKLKRQMAELRARLNRAEARLLEESSTTHEGPAQTYVDLDKQHRSELEDAPPREPPEGSSSPGHDEAVKLLQFCRSTMLHYLSCIIEIAERRNTAVSKLYFDVFGETNGDVQLLSELTDPWRRWAEQLTAHRDRAERTFTHSLERASRNKKLGLEELQTSVGLQHLAWPEPDYGFDRILDLIRLRLASPMPRPESVNDFEFLQCTTSSVSSTASSSTLCGGSGGRGGTGNNGNKAAGGGGDNICLGLVRKSGYLRLARTLHKRMPDIPEERLVACLEALRSQNGGLTGLRISEIREEVTRLVQQWPPSSPVR